MNSDPWLQAWQEQPLPPLRPDLQMIIQAAETHRELNTVDRVNFVVLVVMLLILLIHYLGGEWNVIDGIFAIFPALLAVQLYLNRRERRRQSQRGAVSVLNQLDRDILRTEQWLRARRWFWAPPGGLGLVVLALWLLFWLFQPELTKIMPLPPSQAGWKFFWVFVSLLGWSLWYQFTEHRDFLVRLQELTALRDQFRATEAEPPPQNIL